MNEPDLTADGVVVTMPFMRPEGWGLYALCFMQVCAYCEVPPEQVEARANELNPPGTDGTWKIVWGKEGENVPGDPARFAPVPCQKDPARIHYLLSC